jgi:hypothetical protein
MSQTLHINNHVDEEGRPHGGSVTSEGLNITWQNPQQTDIEGALIESVITAALVRLDFLQSTLTHQRNENALAIMKLQEALHWLAHDQGVQ